MMAVHQYDALGKSFVSTDDDDGDGWPGREWESWGGNVAGIDQNPAAFLSLTFLVFDFAFWTEFPRKLQNKIRNICVCILQCYIFFLAPAPMLLSYPSRSFNPPYAVMYYVYVGENVF